ncbi:poly(hydroxyalkanoate) granule-associated protein [compost metagenome]
MTGNVNSVKGKVDVQLDKIEKAFDARVASALNRIGIPSKQDVAALSAKLDELSALLEHVARTK